MKKVILSAMILAFGLNVNAQKVNLLSNHGTTNIPGQLVKKAPRAFATADETLGENTTKVAYTDQLVEDDMAEGAPDFAGRIKFATEFNEELLEDFRGGKIVGVAFGLKQAVGKGVIFVNGVDAKGQIIPLKSKEIDTQVGWNTVMFAEEDQIEIPQTGGLDFIPGLEYNQLSDRNNPQTYPLSFVTDPNYQSNTHIYCKYQGKTAWYLWEANTTHHLSAYLLVQKSPEHSMDLSVQKVIAGKQYYKADESAEMQFFTRNMGSASISYKLKGFVDGVEQPSLDVTQSKSITQYNTDQFTSTVKIPSNLSYGEHTFTWAVDKLNTDQADQNTANDTIEVKLIIYGGEVPRQKILVEQFTSQYCVWCPYGTIYIQELSKIMPNISRVAIHGDMNERAVDIFTTADGNFIMANEEIEGYPAATFNRTNIPLLIRDPKKIDATISYTSNADKVAAAHKEILESYSAKTPAFVALELSESINPQTRELTINVKGTGVDGSDYFLKDYGLFVYLTEDGLVARQIKGRTWINEYVHDNVFRGRMSGQLGDDLPWEGNTFTKTYTQVIPQEWQLQNMKAVVFVGKKFKERFADKMNLQVNNCEEISLANDTNGITTVNNQTNKKPVAFYNLAGQRVEKLGSGVHIVKYEDGSVRKINVE